MHSPWPTDFLHIRMMICKIDCQICTVLSFEDLLPLDRTIGLCTKTPNFDKFWITPAPITYSNNFNKGAHMWRIIQIFGKKYRLLGLKCKLTDYVLETLELTQAYWARRLAMTRMDVIELLLCILKSTDR